MTKKKNIITIFIMLSMFTMQIRFVKANVFNFNLKSNFRSHVKNNKTSLWRSIWNPLQRKSQTDFATQDKDVHIVFRKTQNPGEKNNCGDFIVAGMQPVSQGFKPLSCSNLNNALPKNFVGSAKFDEVGTLSIANDTSILNFSLFSSQSGTMDSVVVEDEEFRVQFTNSVWVDFHSLKSCPQMKGKPVVVLTYRLYSDRSQTKRFIFANLKSNSSNDVNIVSFSSEEMNSNYIVFGTIEGEDHRYKQSSLMTFHICEER